MSEYRPPRNRKQHYHSVPVKPMAKSGARSGGKPTAKTGKSKYNIPKKQKLPTSVIVTNILMIGVILAICGVVFAIAFNNIKYDRADAAKNSSKTPSVSSAQSPAASGQNTNASGMASKPAVSGGGTQTVPAGDFNADFFKDDLFIGDSIFTGLYGYSYIEHANVAAKTGYTAYGAQAEAFDEEIYSGSAVDYAKSLQPKHIIIMLGSNALSPQTVLSDFEKSNRNLLNALKEGCPNSTLCLVSVPPITADSSMASYSGVTNTIINNANDKLKALCGELDVTYYDLNSVLKGADGYFKEEYAEVDGMHFKSAAYPILLEGVQNALSQE